jgi:hypothetical protein
MDNYNFLEKLFHQIFLENSFLKKNIYEFEKFFFYKKNNESQNAKHIFITGMPRSGTTALLYFLYETNIFSSLTYRSMPLIMAPNFSKFLSKKNIKKKERYHSDNIFFDLNSPESFDEVFFSCFANDDLLVELPKYVSLIIKLHKKKRYLSKNNMNFKRIDLISKAFPNSVFLIPFREPLQHSFSLLSSHNHFVKLQKRDNFILDYMNYLGHFEFGIGHRYWFKPKNFNNKIDINYWLEQWLLVYKEILDNYRNHPNCIFLKYENLKNSKYVEDMMFKLEVSNKYLNNFDPNIMNISIDYDKDLYAKCSLVYEDLSKLI